MMRDDIQIIVKDDPGLMAHEAATLFTDAAMERVTVNDRFTAAISGGTTPGAMYSLLTQEPFISRVPWDKIHLFWVDERLVPWNHPHSNYGSAKNLFIDKIPIPESNVHPMPVEFPPESASNQYQENLMAFFDLEKGNLPCLDLIMLGMGKDGHTASLFPGQQALDEKQRLVISVQGGDPFVNRLTMTLPIINNAMTILVLVSGQGKANTIKSILEDKHTSLPVQRIRPIKGTLKWLLDREAASKLSKHWLYGKS